MKAPQAIQKCAVIKQTICSYAGIVKGIWICIPKHSVVIKNVHFFQQHALRNNKTQHLTNDVSLSIYHWWLIFTH